MQVQKFYFDRIEFRFAEPNDEKAIFEGMDWSVVKNISGAPWPFTLEHAKSFITDSEHDRNNNVCYEFVLIKKDTNEFIGIASLNLAVPNERPGQIGYWIAKSFRGHGYGSEAVKGMIKLAKELKLPLIWASARYDNIPSINLLKKIEMKYVKEQKGIYEGKEMMEVIYEMNLIE